MEFPLITKLRGKKLVLASSSPRRREILSKLNVPFDIIPSTFPETLDKSQFADPADYAQATATAKATEVFDKLKESEATDESLIVVGCDTIVVNPVTNQILEKPVSKQHAYEMLKSIKSLDSHQVMTAIVVIGNSNGKSVVLKHVEKTRVEFGDYVSDEIIRAYCETDEPLDKAGGYGYQGMAAMLVSRINGCYYNIVGLPLYQLVKILNDLIASS